MLRSCVPKNALGLPFTITGSSGRGAISGGIAADSWAAGSSGRPKMPGQESYQRPASVRFRKGTIFRSEEHTSDSSHTVISYAVFCLKKKTRHTTHHTHDRS